MYYQQGSRNLDNKTDGTETPHSWIDKCYVSQLETGLKCTEIRKQTGIIRTLKQAKWRWTHCLSKSDNRLTTMDWQPRMRKGKIG